MPQSPLLDEPGKALFGVDRDEESSHMKNAGCRRKLLDLLIMLIVILIALIGLVMLLNWMMVNY